MMKSSRDVIALRLITLGLLWLAPLQASGEMRPSAGSWPTSEPMLFADRSELLPNALTFAPQQDVWQPSLISPETKRHFFTFAIGAVYWPNLADIDPSLAGYDPQQFGRFEGWGYNLEISYHYLATTWLDRDLWVGLDFGLFYNENEGTVTAIVLPSGSVTTGDIGSRGLYLTPSLKWFVWGNRGSTRFYLGAGAGYYLLDFAELFEWGEGAELYEESTLGGYLSAGIRLPFGYGPAESAALTLETKVHFADFGELAPGTGQIQGPITLFQLGVTF